MLMRSGEYGIVLESSHDLLVSHECQAEDRPHPVAGGRLVLVYCFKAGTGVKPISMS